MSKNESIKSMEYGQNVVSFLMIKESDLKKAKNDSLYLDMILGDAYGNQANAKLWNADGTMASYKTGDLVLVDALVQKFNGRLQLRINRLRLVEEGDDVNIEDFVDSAPENPENMYAYMMEILADYENEELRMLTEYMLEEKKDRLFYYPAAKTHHHAIKAGLLYHTFSMLKLAVELAKLYPFIDRDLLFSGVILHDLSKVDEMVSNELGIVEDYSKEGKLLGHIIQGIVEIDKAAASLGISSECRLLLEHLLLSHHYHAEYGSPKKPLLPEGELLHYIDMIDARMFTMEKVLRDVEPGSFAERNMTLEYRSMYKPDWQA
ncbi:HD domain-containing protein [Alkalibacter rhizosphaerae]|uniref:HD domain-containing protein n=1 Tax=Alkalibacter rhizosphaerae TaxID=2815577 RepID=A0A974XDB3_9FIRM|nr:HD domain-containing protein [Alkalibacter rhizosphaerae]QSX07742.1 HD domain-containing protein [Alkalibacter rhizosphaerae]